MAHDKKSSVAVLKAYRVRCKDTHSSDLIWLPQDRQVSCKSELRSPQGHQTLKSQSVMQSTALETPRFFLFLFSVAHVAFFPLLVMNHNSEKPTEMCFNAYLKIDLLD